MITTFDESPVSQDRRWGVALAIFLHVAIFTVSGLGLLHRAQYGMDFASGETEVDLVAAPAEQSLSAPVTEKSPVIAIVADPDDVVQKPKPVTVSPAMAAPPVPTSTNAIGDESSPVPGKDATTFHRDGGATVSVKPAYYHNPPPAYPDQARTLKQEGRAILEVTVTTEGKVGAVRLKESSGFPLLDQAALQGVQSWRFRPAELGGIRVETTVDVPIRFKLR